MNSALIILFSIIVFSGFFLDKKIALGSTKIYNLTAYRIIAIVVFVFYATFRAYSVGIDTQMYYIRYTRSANYSFFQMLFHYKELRYGTSEIGYMCLECLIKQFGFDFRALLFTVSVLFIVSVTWLIYRFSENHLISFLLFICFGYMSYSMCFMRQFVAISFCLFSIKYVQERKFKAFLACIFMAALFHTSALIFIPFYFVSRIELNSKRKIILVCVIVFVNLFSNLFFRIIVQFGRLDYSNSAPGGGSGMNMYLLVTALIALYFSNQLIEQSDSNRMLVWMAIMSAIVFPVVMNVAAMHRTAYYYTIGSIALIPNLISSAKNKTYKYVLAAFYSFMAVYYLINVVGGSGNQFLPYYFYWQV